MKNIVFLILAWGAFFTFGKAQVPVVGAARYEAYLPLLEGKKVALLVNQTSRVGDSLLPDLLRARGVAVQTLFVPEHGFRGTADAGAHVASGKDPQTGLSVISLYGNNKKPKAADLAGIDVVIYDLQDVGVRFYTYISTLEYLLEACAPLGKTVIVLDRPNPAGFYVDGPVLEPAHKSFVGMQQIPVVYGMTAGEYAQMLVGEKLFAGAEKSRLKVISCTGYNHKTHYNLPVSPSPNLRAPAAVLLYPSLCAFEGTVVSVGRGTEMPFTLWGHPDFKPEGKCAVSFTPKSQTGATAPLYEGKLCKGYRPAVTEAEALEYLNGKMHVQPLLDAYTLWGKKAGFFNANNFFEKLMGTSALRQQIEAGATESEIRKSWQSGLTAFKKVRKKYLLYADFE